MYSLLKREYTDGFAVKSSELGGNYFDEILEHVLGLGCLRISSVMMTRVGFVLQHTFASRPSKGFSVIPMRFFISLPILALLGLYSSSAMKKNSWIVWEKS